MKCRDGHDSTASDFCSECGLELVAVAVVSGPFDNDPTPMPRQLCPACATERDDPSTPFCGVCGYNFITKVGGHMVTPTPAAAAPAAVAPAAVAPKPRSTAPAPPRVPPGTVATTARIEIEVAFAEANPAAPKGEPVRKFSLYDDENLLGRRSSSVAQTVGLDSDDFLSRRHLLIIRQRSGYVVRLFDNTNGGTHNGKEMVAGVELPLAEGDTLAIGSFTVIRVTAIRA